MLIIHLPDDAEARKKERRRRNRALLYLVPVPVVITAIVIAPNVGTMILALAVEFWWLWAVWTDPQLWDKSHL